MNEQQPSCVQQHKKWPQHHNRLANRHDVYFQAGVFGDGKWNRKSNGEYFGSQKSKMVAVSDKSATDLPIDMIWNNWNFAKTGASYVHM